MALFATLLAAWFAPDSDEDAGVVLSKSARRASADARRPGENVKVFESELERRAAISDPVNVLLVQPRDFSSEKPDEDLNLFASVQWEQPVQPLVNVPVASVPVTSPPPQTPPLPFRFIGRYDEGGESMVFLQYGEQNLVVKVGDSVENQYRVEGLHGSTLTFRYLPLDELQTLDVGGVK